MTDELKDFEVWRPPVDADPPLYTERRAEWWERGRTVTKLTWTGVFALALPAVFIISKRLSFGLSTCFLFVASLGSSVGVAASAAVKLKLGTLAIVLVSLALAHLMTYALARGLYNRRRALAKFSTVPDEWLIVLIHLAVPVVAVHVIAIMILVSGPSR